MTEPWSEAQLMSVGKLVGDLIDGAYTRGYNDAIRGAATAVEDLDSVTHRPGDPSDESFDGGFDSAISAVLDILTVVDLVEVRKDSGGVFADGTTNTPAIDFTVPPTLTEASDG